MQNKLAQKVLSFWFVELQPRQWWQKDQDLDQKISSRFSEMHRQAAANEFFSWRDSPEGSLAEILILDQFSRNIFRGQSESFQFDSQALALAQQAISKGFDLELTKTERSFIYLPFMHSESSVIHGEALKLFESLGSENNLDFEHKHKRIIDQFGRYPHRNEILGRESTPEELEFLKLPNSGF